MTKAKSAQQQFKMAPQRKATPTGQVVTFDRRDKLPGASPSFCADHPFVEEHRTLAIQVAEDPIGKINGSLWMKNFKPTDTKPKTRDHEDDEQDCVEFAGQVLE